MRTSDRYTTTTRSPSSTRGQPRTRYATPWRCPHSTPKPRYPAPLFSTAGVTHRVFGGLILAGQGGRPFSGGMGVGGAVRCPYCTAASAQRRQQVTYIRLPSCLLHCAERGPLGSCPPRLPRPPSRKIRLLQCTLSSRAVG